MISVHYLHILALPSLYCCFLEANASERSRLCSAPLLSFSWLAWAPACFCEKAAIKQTQQEKFRSQEFHSLPNEKGCWAVVAACGEREWGRGVRCLLCGDCFSGSRPATWMSSQVSKTQLPKPRETWLHKMQGAPLRSSDKAADAGSPLYLPFIQQLVGRHVTYPYSPGTRCILCLLWQACHSWCLLLSSLSCVHGFYTGYFPQILSWEEALLWHQPCFRLREVFRGCLPGHFCSTLGTRAKATSAQGGRPMLD